MASLIGSKPNQVSCNGDLGKLAFMDIVDTVSNNPYYDTAISDVQPTLNLDFVNSKTLDPRITFARASTATYYDAKSSVIAEQNLLLWSQDFSNASWTKTSGTISATLVTAPDGTTTAQTITANAATASVYVSQPSSPASSASITTTYYCKAGTNNFVQIFGGNGQAVYANFNLSTGAVGTTSGVTATITSVGNSWYRCSVNYTQNGSAGQSGYLCLVQSGTATYAQSYTWAGTETVQVWGAQLEQRSSATAYNATTTTALTNYIPTLQTAPINTARLDYDPVTRVPNGLLIEESRTNLATYSNSVGGTNWTFGGASNTATNIAPDGTQTAQKLTEDTSTGNHRVYQQITIAANTTATLSVYVKRASGTRNLYVSWNFGDGIFASYDLTAGTVLGTATIGTGSVASSSITSVGNGWYRCTITGIASTTVANPYAQFYVSNSSSAPTSTAPSYTGDGFSGLYIWGAQLEAGAFPTSYIPTVASQVTRSADAASMTGTNFSSWWNQSQGSIFVNIGYSNGGTFPYIFSIQSSDSERNYLVKDSATAISTTPFYYQVVASSNTVTLANISANSTKFGLSYSANATMTAVSDITATNSSALKTVPTATSFQIGHSATYGRQMNGTIKKITYYAQALSNAELQEMTI